MGLKQQLACCGDFNDNVRPGRERTGNRDECTTSHAQCNNWRAVQREGSQTNARRRMPAPNSAVGTPGDQARAEAARRQRASLANAPGGGLAG